MGKKVEETGAKGVDGVEEEIIKQKTERQQLRADALEDPEAVLDTGKRSKPKAKVNQGQQDKHIPGTNNYKQELAKGKTRSILSEDPQRLLDDFAGTGQKIGTNKERVDFGKKIGQYYDVTTGTYSDTTKGIIHYDSKGQAHVVPARP